MTEQELEKLIQLHKVLSEEMSTIKEKIDPEKLKELDDLNRDLVITQANALQTLYGIITVRIGLNINSVRNPNPQPVAEDVKTDSNDQKDATKEGDKSEQ